MVLLTGAAIAGGWNGDNGWRRETRTANRRSIRKTHEEGIEETRRSSLNTILSLQIAPLEEVKTMNRGKYTKRGPETESKVLF
jgi:hypothetical protein